MSELLFSKAIDPHTFSKWPTFMILPVRIHKDDALARKATQRFQAEWRAANGANLSTFAGENPFGHIASLTIPECIPARLAIMTKAYDYLCLENGWFYFLYLSTFNFLDLLT